MNARRRPCHLALLLALTCAASAQNPAPRIRGPIEPTPSVPLRGSLNPRIRSASDLGPLPPDTEIRGVTLVFSRSSEQQTALDQLLAGQTNPSSPLFHHWLTPAEFSARFGPAPADVAATQSWLQSRGFSIDSTGSDRITFSGTAAQIQQAFGAEIHRFLWPAGQGETAELHFAPATELVLPASLAPVTSAILHLNDFRPKPNVRAHPNFTSLSGQQHYLAPADIFTMYDLAPLRTAASSIGQGQYIAVIGQSFINVTPGSSGVDTFQTQLAQQNPINMVIVPGSGSEAVFLGDEGESDIDVEYTSGIAQRATIFFVYTGSSSNYGVFDALSFAITQDIAPIVTISYGECEPFLSAADSQQYNAVLQQAAAQGQTVVASSGDSGSTACAIYGSDSGLSVTQQQGLAVNFPADNPYVTAVGGTQMAPGTFNAGSSQYWAPATIGNNASSVLSYIPEVVWNESSPAQGTIAPGGGTSTVYPRPSWQTGVPGIPSGTFRLVPDVSLQASTANPGYIICSDDPSLTGAQSDCSGSSLQTSNGIIATAGGTSFAAPILAGSLALLNQYEHTHGLGNINPVLYSLAAQPSIYSSAFHDITLGTSECVSGDGNCSTAGQSDFAATPGYDQATGLGTLDFNKLALAWPATQAANLNATFAGFTSGAQGSTTPGATVSLGVYIIPTITPNGFTAPTGTVSVSLDGQVVNPTLALAAPSPTNPGSFANITLTAPSSIGSHIVLVSYPGDATHAPSSGAYSLLVGSVTPSGTIALSASNLSLGANGSGSTQIAITPSGGYNGVLNWSATYSGGTTAQTICYIVNSPPVEGPVNATVSIGVGAACSTPGALIARSTGQRASLDPPPVPQPARARLRGELRAAPVLALLLFTFLPRGRRKPLPLLAALIVISLPLTLTGCGGGSGSSGGGGGGGAQSQTYTLTFKAQDSVNTAITASTSFNLTVN